MFHGFYLNDLAPIMMLGLFYGFYYARVHYLLDFQAATRWVLLIGLVDALDCGFSGGAWREYFHSRAILLPYTWVVLAVCDALYRGVFPERVTWRAWLSYRALSNNTVRVGLVMGLFVGLLLVGVQLQVPHVLRSQFLIDGTWLPVFMGLLVFQAIPILLVALHFKRYWYLIAIFSAVVSCSQLLDFGSMTFMIGISCDVIVSALFWCFGIWPALVAELLHAVIIVHPDVTIQFYLGGALLGLLVAMIILQIFTDTQYLSIGAYSIQHARPIRLFEPQQIGDVPKAFLFVSIVVLGLGVKLSDVSLLKKAQPYPVSYQTALAKNRDILANQGILLNSQSVVMARMHPIQAKQVDRIYKAHRVYWQELVPAFIPWGCWQVVTQLVGQKNAPVYEVDICQNRFWTQTFKKSFTHDENEISASKAAQMAQVAIQDALNLAPSALAFTEADAKVPGYGGYWLVRYAIQDEFLPSDLDVFANVDFDAKAVRGVHFRVTPPEHPDGLWELFDFLSINGAGKLFAFSSFLVGIYAFGRRLSKLLIPSVLNVSLYLISGAAITAFYRQKQLAAYMDLLLASPNEMNVLDGLPAIKICIYALLVSMGLRAALQLLWYYPPLNFFATTVMGAVGTLAWIVFISAGIFFGDMVATEASKLWPSFLPQSSLYFSSSLLLVAAVAFIVAVFWGRLLIYGSTLTHLLFTLLFTLSIINYSASVIQAISLLFTGWVVYWLTWSGMRLYGLRVLVPVLSFPLIYWISWVLPKGRLDVQIGGALVLICLFGAIILCITMPRQREENDGFV